MTEINRFNVVLNNGTQEEVNFSCREDELILDAGRRQGVYMASYCKQGACGACGSKLISGSVQYVRQIKGAPQIPTAGDEVRPCSLHPVSDLVLEPVAAWRLTRDESGGNNGSDS